MGAHLSVEQRQRVRRLRGEGMTVADVAREVGCSLRTVKRVVAHKGKREEQATRWCPGPKRLSLAEREEISRGLGHGESFSADRPPTRPVDLDDLAGGRTPTAAATTIGLGGPTTAPGLEGPRRPKAAKLDDPPLAAQVTEWLEAWWSPEEIARRCGSSSPTIR